MVAETVYVPPEVTILDWKLAKKSLRHFIGQAWHVIEPGTPYQDSWHIHAICEHLEAVFRGEIRNLLINMPPRMMKSIAVSVMFPAWVWLHRPEARFLYSSYAQDLATDHSLATRRVVESEWYQERWGDRVTLVDDQNLKTRFETGQRGARIATSVGGVATGKGGDFVIADDPHNVKLAESDAVRESTLLWWDRVMSSRLNDPKRGAKVIVMQRVHDRDLAGHVLEQGGYEHLNLPMEYEEITHVTVIGWRDPRTMPGELLAPDRVGVAEVADLKVRLGSYAYAGQYQQRPSPAEGGTFKRAWWQRYREVPALTRVETFVDSAFKEGVANDYSVFATWGADGLNNYYLLDLWRARVEFPPLIQAGRDQAIKQQVRFMRVVPLVVEDKASGQSAIQVWSRPQPAVGGMLPALSVVSFNVPAGSSKISRAEGMAPLVEARRVFLPHDAPWVDDFIEEHARFPTGAHDDQVDCTSMMAMRFRQETATVIRSY